MTRRRDLLFTHFLPQGAIRFDQTQLATVLDSGSYIWIDELRASGEQESKGSRNKTHRSKHFANSAQRCPGGNPSQ